MKNASPIHRFAARFRFSLRSLLLFVLFGGAAFGTFFWKPWSLGPELATLKNEKVWSMSFSPDGSLALLVTRSFPGHSQSSLCMFDVRKQNLLWHKDAWGPPYAGFSKDGNYIFSSAAFRFLNSRTGEDANRGFNFERDFTYTSDFSPDGMCTFYQHEGKVNFALRRYPPEWTGHFQRPEVWLALLFGVLSVWSLSRDLRRPISNSKPSSYTIAPKLSAKKA